MGRTRQWVCRTRAQRRPLRAGRGSLGSQGDPWMEREDEDCLLLGGQGAEQGGKTGSLPPPATFRRLWCLLLAEPLRGRLVSAPASRSRAEISCGGLNGGL